MIPDYNQHGTQKFGFYSSLALVLLTTITFGFAMVAIPPSGPNCPGDCMTYPYPDILAYYPRDYNWMYLAIFQIFTYIIFIVSNHFNAPPEKKLYGFLSVVFALISATVLLIAYYTQFSVVPISVMKGETEGIAIMTQYNGHGLFIAMEELGYLTMSISFMFLALIYSMKKRLERSIRIILYTPLFITVLAFVFYTSKYGIDRDYRFEVAAITINWLVTITAGILLSILMHRRIKENQQS